MRISILVVLACIAVFANAKSLSTEHNVEKRLAIIEVTKQVVLKALEEALNQIKAGTLTINPFAVYDFVIKTVETELKKDFDGVKSSWDKLKEQVGDLNDYLKSLIELKIKDVIPIIGRRDAEQPAAETTTVQPKQSLKDKLSEVVGKLHEKLKDLGSKVSDKVKEALGKLNDLLKNLFPSKPELRQADEASTTTVAPSVKDKLAAIFGKLKEKLSKLGDKVSSKVKDAIEKVKNALKDLFPNKPELRQADEASTTTVAPSVKDKLSALFGKLKEKLSKLGEHLSGKFQDAVDKLKNALKDLFPGKPETREAEAEKNESISDKLGNIVQTITEKLKNISNAVSSKVKEALDKLNEHIKNLFPNKPELY